MKKITKQWDVCGIGVPFIELGKERRNEMNNHNNIDFKVNAIIVLEHKHGGSLGIGKHSKNIGESSTLPKVQLMIMDDMWHNTNILKWKKCQYSWYKSEKIK